MDKLLENKIAAVRKEVHGAKHLEPEHRDCLQDMLDEAERCANGTPDKINAIGTAVAKIIISDARNVVRAEDRIVERVSEAVDGSIAAAVAAHARSCKAGVVRRRMLLPRVLRRSGPAGWMLEMLYYAWQQSPVLVVLAVFFAHRFGLIKTVLEFFTAAAGN